MNRKQILDDAAKAVLRDRAATHGKPENSFGTIAKLWSIILQGKLREPLEAWETALCMDALKTARIIEGDHKNPDHWTDKVGYAACGGELADPPTVFPAKIDAAYINPHKKRFSDHPTAVSVSYLDKDLEEERTLYVEDHTEIEKRGIIDGSMRVKDPCSEDEAREFGRLYIKEKRSLVPL